MNLLESQKKGPASTREMYEKLKVAIAIISYWSAELTVRCLESLVEERNDARLDIQVFVVDNASATTQY